MFFLKKSEKYKIPSKKFKIKFNLYMFKLFYFKLKNKTNKVLFIIKIYSIVHVYRGCN